MEITPELRGDLGELYFKHLCQQRGYAYIRLEDIYNTFTPQDILEFKYGFDRILIQIPESIVDEIRHICKPTDIDGNPSFVFDFLTCRLGDGWAVNGEINNRDVKDFSWVEVKTGASQLSKHQEETALFCKIKFNVFRITDVLAPPNKIWIKWEAETNE